VLVEERRWVAPEDFAQVLALCQLLPGPNIANCSVVLGRRWFGLSGAITAFLGLFALPFVWVLGLAALYSEYVSHPLVKGIVAGVGITGAGLFLGTAIKLGKPLMRKPVGLAIVAGCFLAVGIARVSLLIVLPAAALIALFAARHRLV
jgi:chromate transporter